MDADMDADSDGKLHMGMFAVLLDSLIVSDCKEVACTPHHQWMHLNPLPAPTLVLVVLKSLLDGTVQHS